MTLRLRYHLHVDVDTDRLPSSVIHAIHTEAEPHDATFVAQLQRYLGGPLAQASSGLADDLPEGFAVRIDDAPPAEQVQL